MKAARARGVELCRLVRISLAPAAAADPLAGWVVASGGRGPLDARLWAVVLASLGIYHGAMALNDWADREQDRRTRPERPLAAGKVTPRAALALGVGLVALGVLAATLAAPRLGAWMALVALLAVGYDLGGRGALRGPFLLGLCRAGNLGAGLFAVATFTAQAIPARTWAVPVAYGAYVFWVSRLARREDEDTAGDNDAEAQARARCACRDAVLALVLLGLVPFATWLVPGGPSPLGAGASAALVAAALLAPARLLALQRPFGRAELLARPFGPAEIMELTGMLLRRLLIVTAALALLALEGGPLAAIVALAILAGYPLSWSLRRAFPPT